MLLVTAAVIRLVSALHEDNSRSAQPNFRSRAGLVELDCKSRLRPSDTATPPPKMGANTLDCDSTILATTRRRRW